MRRKSSHAFVSAAGLMVAACVDHFIAVHLSESTGGKVHSESSADAKPNKTDAALVATVAS